MHSDMPLHLHSGHYLLPAHLRPSDFAQNILAVLYIRFRVQYHYRHRYYIYHCASLLLFPRPSVAQAHPNVPAEFPAHQTHSSAYSAIPEKLPLR